MGHYCHDLDFVVAFFVVSLCFVCLQRCSGEVGRGFLIGSLTHLQCFWFNQLQPQNPALQLACCQIILSIRCGMWALSNSCFSWASLASSVFEKKISFCALFLPAIWEDLLWNRHLPRRNPPIWASASSRVFFSTSAESFSEPQLAFIITPSTEWYSNSPLNLSQALASASGSL